MERILYIFCKFQTLLSLITRVRVVVDRKWHLTDVDAIGGKGTEKVKKGLF